MAQTVGGRRRSAAFGRRAALLAGATVGLALLTLRPLRDWLPRCALLPAPPAAPLHRAPSTSVDRWARAGPTRMLMEPVERPLRTYLHKYDETFNKVVPDFNLQFRTLEQQHLYDGDFSLIVREVTSEGYVVQDAVTGIVGFAERPNLHGFYPKVGSLVHGASTDKIRNTQMQSVDPQILRTQTGVVYEWNDETMEGYILPTEYQNAKHMIRVLSRDIDYHGARRLVPGQFVQFETALPGEVPVPANDDPESPFALRVTGPEVLFSFKHAYVQDTPLDRLSSGRYVPEDEPEPFDGDDVEDALLEDGERQLLEEGSQDGAGEADDAAEGGASEVEGAASADPALGVAEGLVAARLPSKGEPPRELLPVKEAETGTLPYDVEAVSELAAEYGLDKAAMDEIDKELRGPLDSVQVVPDRRMLKMQLPREADQTTTSNLGLPWKPAEPVHPGMRHAMPPRSGRPEKVANPKVHPVLLRWLQDAGPTIKEAESPAWLWEEQIRHHHEEIHDPIMPLELKQKSRNAPTVRILQHEVAQLMGDENKEAQWRQKQIDLEAMAPPSQADIFQMSADKANRKVRARKREVRRWKMAAAARAREAQPTLRARSEIQKHLERDRQHRMRGVSV